VIGEFFGPARLVWFGARGGDGDSAVQIERMIPMSSPDTQFAILIEASKRKDRCLIAPKTLKAAAAPASCARSKRRPEWKPGDGTRKRAKRIR